MKIFLILLLFFHLSTQAKIGNAPVEWGKFTRDDLEMKNYLPDSSAPAVFLIKYGFVHFDTNGGGFEVVYEYTIRIKILKKAGYKYGDIEIPYISKNNTDRFIELKAHTINPGNEGGKPNETVVSKDLILDEDINGFFHKRKFAFPDIREGSILEYTFKIKSDELSFLKKWDFQEEIPVVWCEYRSFLPEILNYSVMVLGMKGINIIEHDNSFQTLFDATTGTTNNINIEQTKYVIKNAIAIREEPFSIHSHSYTSTINLQLNSINVPGTVSKPILKDWKQLSEYIHEAEWFGSQHRQYSFAKKIASDLIEKTTNQNELILAIYNYVKDNISWNGEHYLYIDNLNTNFKTKSGNGTEINSILLCILRAADINADPVLICSRDNGELQKAYPFLKQFNHMLVRIKTENAELILDATDPFRPISLLDKNDVNIPGYVSKDNNFEWIDIKKASPSKSTISFLMSLDKEDNIKGKVVYSCNNYLASTGRKDISKNGLKEYFSNFIDEKFLNIKSDSVTVQNLDSLNNSLVIKSNIATLNTSNDKFIYVTPYINSELHNNPFKDEIRQCPVEFYFPLNQTSSLTLQLPDGYKVSELPKSISVTLPDSAASFTFLSLSTKNIIQVKSILTIDKLFYPVEEYPDVREFFANISRKFSEQIVISKE